jgi:hypothetical protein
VHHSTVRPFRPNSYRFLARWAGIGQIASICLVIHGFHNHLKTIPEHFRQSAGELVKVSRSRPAFAHHMLSTAASESAGHGFRTKAARIL